jgi:hypothetical protein
MYPKHSEPAHYIIIIITASDLNVNSWTANYLQGTILSVQLA